MGWRFIQQKRDNGVQLIFGADAYGFSGNSEFFIRQFYPGKSASQLISQEG
jgi:hypothetical protein